ncbi:MAG: hypothetical protein Q6370_002885 [Candidatus Sigynarchaeota archaeon]
MLEWCLARDIEHVWPFKKRKNVSMLIHSCLKASTDTVFSFLIQGNPARFGAQPPMQAWLFLATRQNEKVASNRRQYLQGKKNAGRGDEKKMHVFVITTQPPAHEQTLAASPHELARCYKHRWYIETTFFDLDRIQPTCHARTDAAKIFCTMMRC